MSKDGTLPSYEESINANFLGQRYTSSASAGQQIRDRVQAVREEQIATVIDDHVYPLISQQAMYGIDSMTIALMPSDVVLPRDERVKSEFDFDAADGPQMEVVGFPEQLQQIQLKGHMNRLDFWKQQGVVEELQRTLNEKLDIAPQSPVSAMSQQPSLPQRPIKRGLFGWKPSSAEPEMTTSGTMSDTQKESKNVKVTARLEEFCLRTVSAFGLYETLTRQGIIIKFSARC